MRCIIRSLLEYGHRDKGSSKGTGLRKQAARLLNGTNGRRGAIESYRRDSRTTSGSWLWDHSSRLSDFAAMAMLALGIVTGLTLGIHTLSMIPRTIEYMSPHPSRIPRCDEFHPSTRAHVGRHELTLDLVAGFFTCLCSLSGVGTVNLQQ